MRTSLTRFLFIKSNRFRCHLNPMRMLNQTFFFCWSKFTFFYWKSKQYSHWIGVWRPFNIHPSIKYKCGFCGLRLILGWWMLTGIYKSEICHISLWRVCMCLGEVNHYRKLLKDDININYPTNNLSRETLRLYISQFKCMCVCV